MPCEARGLPGNFTVTWFRENHAVRSIPWLESRTLLKRDGTLVISPVHSDDRGLYSCEVTNGIGEPQRASAYIEVECKFFLDVGDCETIVHFFPFFFFFKDPARVTFTPTVQYLPLRLSGVVRCHVEAHPLFQFITWTKDKRIFDPFETPNVGVLKNGSLLFEKVLGRSKGRWADVAKSASCLGDTRKSRALYLHAVQRARNCRLVGHHGSAGQRTADIRDSTQTHIPAQDRRWRPDGLRGSRNPQSPRHLEKSTLQFLSFFFCFLEIVENPLWFSFANWMDRWTGGLCLATAPGRNLAYWLWPNSGGRISATTNVTSPTKWLHW